MVEWLTELGRGGLVRNLLFMTVSDVTPQRLSAQDKRVYLAHVFQRCGSRTPRTIRRVRHPAVQVACVSAGNGRRRPDSCRQLFETVRFLEAQLLLSAWTTPAVVHFRSCCA